MNKDSTIWRWALFPLLVVSFSGMFPRAVFADAREHFARGESAYRQGQYELAEREWEAAYKLDKRPRFLYNLALVYERLGKLDKAIDSLKSFVASAEPSDPSMADANSRLAAIKERLARTGIVISGGVEGAAIFVDGKEWGRTPRPDKIVVTPGSHEVVLRHASFQDFVANVVVSAGEVATVKARMNPKVAATGQSPAIFAKAPSAGPTRIGKTASTNDSDTRFFSGDKASANEAKKRDPTLLYILGGALAVGAIGSAVWAADRHGKLADCQKQGCDRESALRREQGTAVILTLGFAAGATVAFVYAID